MVWLVTPGMGMLVEAVEMEPGVPVTEGVGRVVGEPVTRTPLQQKVEKVWPTHVLAVVAAEVNGRRVRREVTIRRDLMVCEKWSDDLAEIESRRGTSMYCFII